MTLHLRIGFVGDVCKLNLLKEKDTFHQPRFQYSSVIIGCQSRLVPSLLRLLGWHELAGDDNGLLLKRGSGIPVAGVLRSCWQSSSYHFEVCKNV